MTQNVSPTRMELLRVKTRKKLAIKGYNLLKKKRDTLIKTLFSLIKNYKSLKIETIRKLNEAYSALHISQGVSGVNRMKGLALSACPCLSVDFQQQNLMGVSVPKLTIQRKEQPLNASLIGTSYYVEEVRKRFLDLLPDMLHLSEIEQAIYQVAEEVKKTKRRVNALEFVKIPEIEDTEHFIKQQLAEIERESFTRLKNVKKKLEAEHH